MTTLSNCSNCNSPLDGPFCSNCGQNQKDFKRFFLSLVNEAFDGVFSFDSRAWKTFYTLLFKPGRLTNEFFGGRRASYVAPLRLYLISSVLFFLTLSAFNFLNQFDISSDTGVPTSTEPQFQEQASSSPEETPAFEDGSATQELDDELNKLKLELGIDEDDSFNIPLVSKETSKKIEQMLRDNGKKATENPGDLAANTLNVVPPIIFILLPVFALLLKLIYFTKGVYYSEHLVFALHIHSFAFLIFVFFSLSYLPVSDLPFVSSAIAVAMLAWPPIYLWLALKRVYKQGKFFTCINFIILNVGYAILLGIGMIIALIVGLVTL